jgi:23S rRNA (guanosine2251-2'-O)-methyltransferase
VNDSESYLDKKAFFDKMLTVYGRHAVLEALGDEGLELYRLHLSTSNKPSKELDRITSLAGQRGVEIVHHDKASLSRISKNTRQDQGVALDIVMSNFLAEGEFIVSSDEFRVIALDGVANPQNLGMIIRSCAAGSIDALLLPTKGNAQITPLVIQASTGTIFKLPIIKTSDLKRSLENFARNNTKIFALQADASKDYRQTIDEQKAIFVLGNESEGISAEISLVCNDSIAVEMNRGVESLNVAVTAALLAFM